MLTTLRPSIRLIYPRITDIKITLGGHNVIYLLHQLMQHKSIFAQTGRATYITLMTAQSQGGATNESKCNYRPPLIWKQNKPPALSCGAQNAGTGINLPHVTTQRYNWLSCHYLDQCSDSSSGFPLADGHHSPPDIHKLIIK